jgi:ABC-type spermidine/putrescine transport system permease subunit II
MNTMKQTKFQIGDILPIAMVLVVAGIAISFGLSVQEDVQSDFTANSAAANASLEAIDGVATLAEKLPIIATVVAAAIIIGVLIRYMTV